AANAAGELLDDAVLPLLHLRNVDANSVGDDAHPRAVILHLLVSVAGADERLGRHAPPVEANAADLFLLDADDLLLQLSAPNRADIAARAATDHHHVAGSLRHLRPSSRGPLL